MIMVIQLKSQAFYEGCNVLQYLEPSENIEFLVNGNNACFYKLTNPFMHRLEIVTGKCTGDH